MPPCKFGNSIAHDENCTEHLMIQCHCSTLPCYIGAEQCDLPDDCCSLFKHCYEYALPTCKGAGQVSIRPILLLYYSCSKRQPIFLSQGSVSSVSNRSLLGNPKIGGLINDSFKYSREAHSFLLLRRRLFG